MLGKAEAVLLDKRDGAVLFVFNSGKAKAKLVVRSDMKLKAGRNHKERVNAVRSGGVVDRVQLTDEKSYLLLDGKL